jgi:hypothetical protein
MPVVDLLPRKIKGERRNYMPDKNQTDNQKPVDKDKSSKPNQDNKGKEQLPFHNEPNADTEKTTYTEHGNGYVDF